MRFEYELPAADKVVVGTVGAPGQRVFYLQAREGPRLVTLKLEKGHVAELSARVIALLTSRGITQAGAPGHDELEEPVEPDFVVGGMSVAFDDDGEHVVIEAEELGAEEDEELSVARIGATLDQLARVARRGAELVAAGRPSCPLCGYPLDPRGHVCPRSNGHGPPRT
jgi:uncharacterized repeat protein (TIGR03847 family)